MANNSQAQTTPNLPQIRFLIISDTHDDAFPPPSSLPTADVLIHCGDLTQIGGLSNYGRALESLAACSAELKLVIPGNHDVSLDAEWWAENLEEEDDPMEPARARALFESPKFTSRGVRFLEEGTHPIALQDGRCFTVYASQYTPAFGGYAFGYEPASDRFNAGPLSIPKGVDVVVMHGPARPPSPAPSENDAVSYRLDIGHKGQHCGCVSLWRAIERVRPIIHSFGHIHEGHGAQVATFDKGEVSIRDAEVLETHPGALSTTATINGGKRDKTLLVNAAIMRRREEENNKPWLVDMIL